MNTPASKYCPACHTTKEASDFYRHPLSPDRLEYTCQECKRAYVKAQYNQRQARRRPSCQP